MHESGGVLAGVTVVDLSEQVPGPNATRLLTGLGADVVKIERPDHGDRLRPRAAMFAAENRGKRSLAVDLKSDRGRAAVLRLLAGADVLVEGYRPGVMDRLGLGFADVAAVSPRILYTSISGYGATGPYRDLPGHDFQYLSYAAAIPAPQEYFAADYVPTTVPVADMSAALYATMAILLGIMERRRDPDGFAARHLDVAMADCALAMMEPRLAEAATMDTGAALSRPGYGIYQTADGRWLTLGALEDHFWARLVDALDMVELDDPELATFTARRGHAGRIDEALRKRLRALTRDDALAVLVAGDVPAAPVYEFTEPLDDRHFRERGMVHGAQPARVAEWPTALAGFASRERLTPPPAIGEHSSEILRAAGLPRTTIDDLIRDGVVRQDSPLPTTTKETLPS